MDVICMELSRCGRKQGDDPMVLRLFQFQQSIPLKQYTKGLSPHPKLILAEYYHFYLT